VGVIRLRNAIERASQRPWLGLLVIACLAVLLVLVAFHSFDHAVELTAAVTCLAVAVAGVFLVGIDSLARELVRAPRHGRPPPHERGDFRFGGLAPPGWIPLRR
jgi:hypothetical protein